MIVHTETGSVYEFDGGLNRFRRVNSGEHHDMVRDGEWVHLIWPPHIEVGNSMFLMIRPGEPGFERFESPMRMTSPVTEVTA